jgi:hypothetical protein
MTAIHGRVRTFPSPGLGQCFSCAGRRSKLALYRVADNRKVCRRCITTVPLFSGGHSVALSSNAPTTTKRIKVERPTADIVADLHAAAEAALTPRALCREDGCGRYPRHKGDHRPTRAQRKAAK